MGDPMYRWILPDEDTRQKRLTGLNGFALRYGMRYGRVTGVEGGKGVAIWLPPGVGVTIPGLLRSGLLAVPFRAGLGALAKFGRAMDTMDKLHQKNVPGRHLYLMLLGVDPELQGQGVGSALVREGLEIADDEKVPGYLETSETTNLPFYGKFGFEVVDEMRFGDSPPAWALRRPAAV
jgi:ribosomal protein S18 acetylase RimI-like enzyme